MTNLNYKTIYKKESFGYDENFGIEILMASSNPKNLENRKIQKIIYTIGTKIYSEIKSTIIARDPKAQELAKTQRSELISCFKEPIFIEEIPNEYCSNYCCKHLPWFIITTSVGRFKIGFIKKAIHIDWSETIVNKKAFEIFANENVMIRYKYINAWSIEEAKEYISYIITYAKKETY